jgi:hypothetical protein
VGGLRVGQLVQGIIELTAALRELVLERPERLNKSLQQSVGAKSPEGIESLVEVKELPLPDVSLPSF